MYWAKVFDIQNLERERKYTLLSSYQKLLVITKLQSNVERSHSENNNTLRLERSSLSNESLMGLRQRKEHARKWTGAEDVDTLDKGIIKEMLVAYSNYINRKKRISRKIIE